MVIIPTQDNIVIKLPKVDKERKTESGIILTASNVQQDLPEKGVVVAVGAGRVLNNGTQLKPFLKEGDEIIFNKFAGTKISAGDEEYLIIKENDVLAIIKNK